MSPFLVGALVLLLVAAVLVFLEVFLPSMGALGSLAVASILAATFMAYKGAGIWGAVGLLAAAGLLIPATIALALHLFPRTPLGVMLLDQPPPNNELEEETAGLKLLVGQHGTASSKMLPSGDVKIRGKTFDAVSEGDAIDAGQLILVVAVKMNRLVVRPFEAGATGEALATAATSAETTASEEDPLARPIDELGIEPLDPLA